MNARIISYYIEIILDGFSAANFSGVYWKLDKILDRESVPGLRGGIWCESRYWAWELV